ncbi:MAG: phage-related protein (TIGR01555 family) [Myxococcota bacterium]|jgi:phage-related protein (TIGR01555 family)
MPSPLNIRGRIADVFSDALPATPSPVPTGVPTTDAAGIHHDAAGGAETGSGHFSDLSGMGGLNDKSASARPNLYRLYLNERELIAELRSGPYRRICEILPRWATWKGVTVTDDTDDEAPLQQALTDLSVMARIAEADTWARGLGEAMIWMVTDDPADLSEPLDPTTVRAVRNLVVLDAREFSPATYETDPEDPQYGKPSSYHIHPRRMGIVGHSEPVHHTRLLRFVGHDLPHGTRGALGTLECDAIGQVLWDALRNLGQTSAAGAVAAQELSVGVFKLQGLAGKMASGDPAAMLKSVKNINKMKSLINAVLLGRGDDYQRIPFNPSGYKDLLEGARLALALVTSIPLALLFGEAPAGLSTDEKSWWANWTATVSQHQLLRYTKPLQRLIRCLYAAAGGEPEDWSVSWNPIGELSERELAEIRKLHTEADSMALADGVLLDAQVRRSRYGPEGFSLTIQPLTPEEQAELEAGGRNGEDPDEDGELSVRRILPGPINPALDPAEPVTEDRADALARQITAAQRRVKVRIPGVVQNNARKVQRWLASHPTEMRALSKGDRDRLAHLAKGGTIRVQELIAINAWHAKNRQHTRSSPMDKTKPWTDAGYVRGLAWGGEVMARLAIRQVTAYARRSDAARLDVAEDSVVLAIEVPKGVGYRTAQAHVRSLLPDLALETWPHITLLYMGAIPAAKMRTVRGIVREVIAAFLTEQRRGDVLEPERLGHFGPAEATEIPVVLSYYGYGLRRLHTALLRALAHLISVPQHPQLRLHATLGYLHRSLSPDESAVLLQTSVDEDLPGVKDWTPAAVQLRRGGEVVESFPLLSAQLDACE